MHLISYRRERESKIRERENGDENNRIEREFNNGLLLAQRVLVYFTFKTIWVWIQMEKPYLKIMPEKAIVRKAFRATSYI